MSRQTDEFEPREAVLECRTELEDDAAADDEVVNKGFFQKTVMGSLTPYERLRYKLFLYGHRNQHLLI